MGLADSRTRTMRDGVSVKGFLLLLLFSWIFFSACIDASSMSSRHRRNLLRGPGQCFSSKRRGKEDTVASVTTNAKRLSKSEVLTIYTKSDHPCI